tara:strand:- start:6841 stop:7398 length:558 start_codon:yes stop_codon:yes gene_type:complete
MRALFILLLFCSSANVYANTCDSLFAEVKEAPLTNDEAIFWLLQKHYKVSEADLFQHLKIEIKDQDHATALRMATYERLEADLPMFVFRDMAAEKLSPQFVSFFRDKLNTKDFPSFAIAGMETMAIEMGLFARSRQQGERAEHLIIKIRPEDLPLLLEQIQEAIKNEELPSVVFYQRFISPQQWH